MKSIIKKGTIVTRNGVRLFIGSALILSIGLLSCKDDDSEPEPTDNHSSELTVQVNQPISDTTYNISDTVWISALVTGEHDLHEYAVQINNTTESKSIFMAHGHIHTESHVQIDTFWVNDVAQNSDMELIIQSSDHAGGAVSDTTHFHCNN